MSILKRMFGIKKKESSIATTNLNDKNSELSGLEKFKSKNDDDRMRDIMILGDTGNPKAFKILKYAILNDHNSGVVMAALKRLPNFKENKQVIPLLEQLKNKRNIKKYEPYYSMALLNLKLINEEE
ncbi:MAG: HEAT repeat protein, partial [Dokdonia sp.]